MNNLFAITHEFDGNVCKLRIPIAKCEPASLCQNCDVFVDDHNLVFVADSEIKRFKCERQFDTKDMTDIPLSFDSELYEYTCRLPCYPDDSEDEKIVKSDQSPGCSQNAGATTVDLTKLLRITDSCVLTVDGKVCGITADYGYGFADRYRGSPKYSELELSRYCRLTTPNLRSPIRRSIQREKDEAQDFRPDHYKTNFFELQQPDGDENPMQYTRSCENTKLTKDEEAILNKITAKDFIIKLDASQQMHTDFGLISILLAICYDIRTTYNEPTCESPWTRTILSATFSYFERFENLNTVVESFLRRSLIYPLYRNFDLSMLCVEDAVEALQKGKAWVLKQLLVTYCGFSEGDYERRAFKKYFLRDYIRYVSSVLDNDQLHMLSMNLKNIKLDSSKKQLRLGLAEIESELLMELLDTIHLTTLSEVKEVSSSGDSEGDTNAICESEFSEDEDDSSVEQDARGALDIGW